MNITIEQIDELSARFGIELPRQESSLSVYVATLQNLKLRKPQLDAVALELLRYEMECDFDDCPAEFYAKTTNNWVELDKSHPAYTGYHVNFKQQKFQQDNIWARPVEELVSSAIGLMKRIYLFHYTDAAGNRAYEPISWMMVRVALQVSTMDRFNETLNALHKYYVHSSPTMFNALGQQMQLAACFLISQEPVSTVYKEVALISRKGGGIGLDMTDFRTRGQPCEEGPNAYSNMLKTMNGLTGFFNQSGRRKASIAIYLEMFHMDLLQHLNAKGQRGEGSNVAPDVFFALWMCDEFMRRAKNRETWTLLQPGEHYNELHKVHGAEFEQLYRKYEKTLAYKTVDAYELLTHIVKQMCSTGAPFMLFKDTINRNNNCLEIINNGNLCTEIVQPSGPNSVAVCVLASVRLGSFHRGTRWQEYNFRKLGKIVELIVCNLNNVLDRTRHPLDQSRTNSLHYRSIGIGVQDFAGVLFRYELAWTDQETRDFNFALFETIYLAAVTATNRMAAEFKQTIECKLAQGVFNWELMGAKLPDLEQGEWGRWLYPVEELRQQLLDFGVMNQLLIALMPTATTAGIFGNVESIEPLRSNFFTLDRDNTIIMVNPYLFDKLDSMGMWNDKTIAHLRANDGSIATLDVGDRIKQVFKTSFEIGAKVHLGLVADRQLYVDQAQSCNLFVRVEDAADRVLSGMFYAWEQNVKSTYYVHTGGIQNAAMVETAPVCNRDRDCTHCD